jgi:hypothetical protein
MFQVGDLIKRKALNVNRTRAYCVIVDMSEDKYIIYNNSLKCLQTLPSPIVLELYSKVNV